MRKSIGEVGMSATREKEFIERMLEQQQDTSLPKPRDQATGGRDDAHEGDAPTPS